MTAGGNVGKGKSSGSETSYLTSQVGSKDSQTILQSGNTTNIIGGQVQGKGVKVDAKELNIESLQNTANYNSTQQNIEGQVTVGFGGASASGSANKTNINANYASVQDQAGIYAGDNGYQINVKNNTDLKGAIITSNPLAETLNKNSLSTGTLTSTDLHNQTEYDAKGLGVSGGVNVKGGWDGSGKIKKDDQAIASTNQSTIKKSDNAASAELKIDGITDSKLLAHSRINTSDPERNIVGTTYGIFKTEKLPTASGMMVDRATDSEAKIFEYLAQKLGNRSLAKGSITIMTERPACSSCLGVAEQFKSKYPNITVIITDNNGVILNPNMKAK
ncbi:deaminase domain-containing protein [Acinetobacter soli]|uniref:deaminase domain-containing protein n=1 Tax=Acinetobacter soli TaxID=487316 RepID=UPI00148F18B2|nr:deaminase domain-containing protein [Acinetobacter soli]